MVAAVRRGLSQHAVARRFKKALRTVQRWLARAGQRPLGQVDWSDRSRAPRRQARQTSSALERRIVALRQQLQCGALGFIGAQAIHDALRGRRSKTPPPSVRTIGRILRRHGWRVIRLSERDIIENLDRSISRIRKLIPK